MLTSMTGFGRAQKNGVWGNLSVEISSVNHRFQEVFLRLPRELGSWEIALDRQIRRSFSRGKVEVRVVGRDDLELVADLRTSVMRLRRRLMAERDPENPLSFGQMVVLGLLMVSGLWTRLMSSLQGVMANVQLPL